MTLLVFKVPVSFWPLYPLVPDATFHTKGKKMLSGSRPKIHLAKIERQKCDPWENFLEMDTTMHGVRVMCMCEITVTVGHICNDSPEISRIWKNPPPPPPPPARIVDMSNAYMLTYYRRCTWHDLIMMNYASFVRTTLAQSWVLT